MLEVWVVVQIAKWGRLGIFPVRRGCSSLLEQKTTGFLKQRDISVLLRLSQESKDLPAISRIIIDMARNLEWKLSDGATFVSFEKISR